MKRLSSKFSIIVTLLFSPFIAQAKVPNPAQTSKEAIVRSCPNRLCPVVKIVPKDTEIYWTILDNGFVNIANTTFWVALSDLK